MQAISPVLRQHGIEIEVEQWSDEDDPSARFHLAPNQLPVLREALTALTPAGCSQMSLTMSLESEGIECWAELDGATWSSHGRGSITIDAEVIAGDLARRVERAVNVLRGRDAE
jgi:hypothetical protein